ncbi:MAG: NYN domain-containing protein [Candidatus Aminicenantes bacterium]|nr:NYN domain-containing protein [Candidatus Aminicenantes bacterium]
MTNQMNETPMSKIALLIDGDNAQPSLIDKMLTETGKHGSVTIRRIYGDWTKANMKGWKDTLNINAIQPIQQFRYTTGKNSTDSAMIIDAMDILHSDQVDGFCLVSSDSDYTRLATRIREEGYFVLGIGKELTPKPFVNACNVFIYTENLIPMEPVSKEKRDDHRKTAKTKKIDPVPLLKGAFDMAVQEDGWANLGTMGFYLQQLDPGFDPRTYGFKQLNQLIRRYSGQFELRFHEEAGRTVVYVRAKEYGG